MTMKLCIYASDARDARPTLWHWCPGCKVTHPIPGNHPDGGWTRSGTDEAPTFAPSVLQYAAGKLHGRCHYFIQAGKILFQPDCDHELKGQTVDLPDMPEAELRKFAADEV